MIKLEKTVTPSREQWERVIMGMRNPMNSWARSDSDYRPILCSRCDNCMSYQLEKWEDCDECETHKLTESHKGFMVGANDHKLMISLANAGPVHAKYRRMITVYVDITAPLYWWKEFDTYKIGTVSNSCSTMHKIHEKEFTQEDFSIERLNASNHLLFENVILPALNKAREDYLNAKRKEDWDQMIQLLPSSYNQKRTIMMNYEVLTNIYDSRQHHKLQEWRELCEWIENLPYSEIITGEIKEV